MSRENFTPRERVAHKLTGAAYQMTFCEEYDLAMETLHRAIQFWEETREEPLDDVEASERYPTERQIEPGELAQADGGAMQMERSEEPDDADDEESDLSIPGDGTQSRECLFALLNAHNDGNEWVRSSELTSYGASSRAAQQMSVLKTQHEYIHWKNVDGERYHLYRIDPDMRPELREAIINDD